MDGQAVMAREESPEPARMGRLLVGDEQVPQRHVVAREDRAHLPLDDREVLRMPGLDQQRRPVAEHQIAGIVAVIRPAPIVLLKAVAEPENAWCQLARQRVVRHATHRLFPRGT
jgi:hypothetical protein